MQQNCMREASRACFNTCCVNPEPEPELELETITKQTRPVVVDLRRDFITAILSSIQPTNTNFTNHESLPKFTQLISTLINTFPHYSNTFLVDDIRAREYYNLRNRVCLDYVGNGLFSYYQLQNYNPTPEIYVSSSSSSTNTPFFSISYGTQESQFEAAMRKRIMKHMNVFEDDYSLVFTANQSSAFKLLADSYPFHSNQTLLTVYDHENESVQSMIEVAKKKGAKPLSALFSWPNFRVHSRKLRKLVVDKNKRKNRGLFVIPLQSRMTGSRYSYQWMNLARDNGWHVLLDACALAPKEMETLGLSLFQPDFLTCSFYKIFGENPSGFCCLLVKKSITSDLTKSSSTMGLKISLIPTPFSISTTEQTSEEISKRVEIKQNELSFSEIVLESDQNLNNPNSTSELKFNGLDHADTLGLILISSRARILINWLVNALLSLRHPHSEKGLPLVAIYGPKIKLDRGPFIAFNVYDWKGEKVDPILVQKLADRNRISLNCGFLKNIWFSEDFQEEKKKVLENSKHDDDEKRKGKMDYGIEVVSVSLGMLSNFEDMYRVWSFVSRFLDADFVEKERWRYTALNQKIVEV